MPREEGTGRFMARAALGLLVFAVALVVSLPFFMLPVICLVIWAIVLTVQGRYRGFPLGVFLGLGLTLLGIGICLANFRI